MIEDYSRVYTEGPWVVMDHYVTVRKWQHDFKPDEAEEDTTAIWMRFPNLPIDEQILFHVVKAFGSSLKVDINTAMAARGKYAWVCIETDLRKPLISHFTIGKYTYTVEYEHLHSFCFSCGRVGHCRDKCSDRWPSAPVTKHQDITVAGETDQNGLAPSRKIECVGMDACEKVLGLEALEVFSVMNKEPGSVAITAELRATAASKRSCGQFIRVLPYYSKGGLLKLSSKWIRSR